MGASSATNWWLRSANSATNAHYVNSNGNMNNNNVNNTNALALGSSHMPDKVIHWMKSVQRGEKESMTLPWISRVNQHPDASGRTLLAWRRLQVFLRFMPGDAMYLMQPVGKIYGVWRFI